MDGHKADNKRPTTTMKTFSALGLKPHAPEKEKKKDKKKKDSFKKKTHAQKEKSKTSGEKKKKRRERSLSLISEERRTCNRRLLKLAKESSPLSKVEDEVSVIGAIPINLIEHAIQHPATRATRPAQRGKTIREPMPQEQPAQEQFLEGKGKKKLKQVPIEPSRDSTPFPLRRARREDTANKLKEEARLQKQRNLAIGVGASEPRSSSFS